MPEQVDITSKISKLIEQSKLSQAPFPHTLLIGIDEVAKRDLAFNIIAKELGAKITEAHAGAFPHAGDLVGTLTNLGDRDILFIRDIHRMKEICVEFLIPALEENKIDFVFDKGPYAKHMVFNIRKFTLIATVPDKDTLSRRLKNLFTCTYNLPPMSGQELCQALIRELKAKSVEYEDQIPALIAKRSKGNLGEGIGILRKAIQYLQISQTKKLTEFVLKECFDLTEHDIPDESNVSQSRLLSDDVKREVWRRDMGKCVKCGSNEKLEFDHVIPASRGGNNTVRNIQLLCEQCNREKRDSI